MTPLEYIWAATDEEDRRRRKSEMFHILYGGPAQKLTDYKKKLAERVEEIVNGCQCDACQCWGPGSCQIDFNPEDI
jgi:hypothetical protein